MTHFLSNSGSSSPIRTPLKSVNHASKYRIYESFHYFGAHFNRDTMFCNEKDAQNDVTQVNLFIMTMKSLFEVQNTNNSEFRCN